MAPSVMTIGCFGGACAGDTLPANLTFAALDSAPTWTSGLPLLGREPATSLPYAFQLPGALAAGLTSTLDHSSWTQRGGLGLCITRAPPPAHLSSQPPRFEGVCLVRRLVFAVNGTHTTTKSGINRACRVIAPLLPTCPTDAQPVKHRLSPTTATPCSWACSPSQEFNKTTTASPAAALLHTSHLDQASGITALLSVIAGVACVAVCFRLRPRSTLRARETLAPEHTNPSDPTSTSPSNASDKTETLQSIAGSPSTAAPAAELAPTVAAPWAIGNTQSKRVMFKGPGACLPRPLDEAGAQEAVSRLTDRLLHAEHEAVSSIVDELLLDVEQAAGPLPEPIASLHAAPASSAASPFAGLGAASSSSGTNASSPLLEVVVQHEAEQLQAEPAAATAVPLAARSRALLDVSSGDSMVRMHRWSSSSSGLADTSLPALSSAGDGSISISIGSPGEGLRGFSSSPSSNSLSSCAMTMAAAAAAAAAPSATGHVATKVWRQAGSFWGSMRTKVQQRLSSGGSSSSGGIGGSSSSAPAGLQLLVSDAASFDAAPTTPGGSAAAGTARDQQQPQLQPSTEAAAPAASAAAHTVLAALDEAWLGWHW